MSITTIKIGSLEYLTAEGISVPHCFTTRLGGVSTGSLASLNLGMHRGDAPENVVKNFEILGNAVGFSPEQLVLTHQTHSDVVRVVTKADALGLDNRAYPECDALITNDPGTALMVFTADCAPVLLHDPVTGAVGAAHAGWRGTAADIAGKTVRAMVRQFGCDPKNIRAAIGPCIAECCFETDGDVPMAVLTEIGKSTLAFIRPYGDKFYVNLKEINVLALRRTGVEYIEVSKDCTMCQRDRYWSHRYLGSNRGSQGAVIVCREVTP